ncbi:respiratory nitrate reductase chaperone NarJ [Pseudomonas knackmussii B13]|uniref:Respiratory nitrate reductase chaperone NarJ n=2 Tax=Pseudomonas TaxID=286 RepID=A0A024HM31_PSEKB|nr:MULTISPECIES: nitrate reductase molybdenum cofactor assembly chaperone [Pseudomonas]CDF85689.1 respiratory nitrate reductase chaperone NarJ [Pseudomonas knackmussii B13]SDI45440.1 respiratory nitrate reductase chaperone NarJ [Pseudomonas panipatensis]SMP70352.1 respiratory nitrate reductase chaperone NarJ [Pseudomonas panipatensis]
MGNHEPCEGATVGLLSLRVLARLLDYPVAELQAASAQAIDILDAEERLPAGLRTQLAQWCRELAATDLLDLQEDYVDLFDRGRATSLLLFEHVHGESRDRGQAMVDLLAQYEAAGFQLDARELPDYLPLFLEYLSTREHDEIGQWLGDIQHILALLAARLEERGSDYALVPRALLALIGATDAIDAQRTAVEAEQPDNTPQALDAVWEEEVVRFNAESDRDCSLQSAEGRRLAERKYETQPQVIQVMPSALPDRH